jgi:hypothetical protein
MGINRILTDDGKGRLVGDVAYAEAAEIAAAITRSWAELPDDNRHADEEYTDCRAPTCRHH